MNKPMEIGELLKIDLKKERERILVHVRGNPVLEAQLARKADKRRGAVTV